LLLQTLALDLGLRYQGLGLDLGLDTNGLINITGFWIKIF